MFIRLLFISLLIGQRFAFGAIDQELKEIICTNPGDASVPPPLETARSTSIPNENEKEPMSHADADTDGETRIAIDDSPNSIPFRYHPECIHTRSSEDPTCPTSKSEIKQEKTVSIAVKEASLCDHPAMRLGLAAFVSTSLVLLLLNMFGRLNIPAD